MARALAGHRDPEELRFNFKIAGRYARTIDLHKRPVARVGPLVNHTRNQLAAGTGLTAAATIFEAIWGSGPAAAEAGHYD